MRQSGKDAMPALFLDRDGTIIEDVGILRDPRDIRLFPDTVEALRRAAARCRLFVITNQGGVSRGLISEEEVASINGVLGRMLAEAGIVIDQWYVCPHERSDGCRCIKPNSHFMQEARRKWNIDLSRSFMIGDHPHDVLTGEEEGVFGLYLLTGHGLKHLSEVPLDKPVFHNLGAAVDWMLAHPCPVSDLERLVDDGAAAIREGRLTAFPTETVYGLGADALSAEAAAAIFSAKHRPLHDPLIVHLSDPQEAARLTTDISPAARRLMQRFWPGPLTLVLPKSDLVPGIVTAGNPTVALRIPAHPLALKLIERSRTPVAAPSANLFGRTSPTTARHVEEQLAGSYRVLIDGGACRVGVESTVVSLIGSRPRILRPGGVTAEELSAEIGPIDVGPAEEGGDRISSPGLLPSHYAPNSPLVLTDRPEAYAGCPDCVVILPEPTSVSYAGTLLVLSGPGDLPGAAAMLYRTMRIADALRPSLIVAARFPDAGIGKAANDRLSRAAAAAGGSAADLRVLQ